MKTEPNIISKLKANGVKNPRDYGYPDATVDNIMTDEIYSGFFKSMLKDNLGHGHHIDLAINALIAELNK